MRNTCNKLTTLLSTMIAYVVTLAFVLFAFIIIFAIVMVLFATTLAK